ncbi:MAG: hypothetical protein K6V97_06380 [Actinomycetia bacterium]|nr:hypothetical protein [Actinomycetes bacterium]
MAEQLCRPAVETPFNRGAASAQALLAAAVDGETLRRLTDGVGSVAEAAEHAAQAAGAAGRMPAPTGPGPAGLLVAMAEAMVPTDRAWHAAKVGLCQALRRTRAGTWARTGTPDACVGLEARQRLDAQDAAQGWRVGRAS